MSFHRFTAPVRSHAALIGRISVAGAGSVLWAACIASGSSAFAATTPAPPPSQSSSQPNHASGPIGSIAIDSTAESIRVSGAVTLSGQSTMLGNGSTVTAGDATLPIHLTRGGNLDLCAHTELHLSQEDRASDPNSPLMLALDHGALEAHYSIGKNSDVILTPDLRILLSGPGKADVRIRVNRQGDTCVDNRGAKAPYVTVSEQIGAGVYRVEPDQRVMFEHGSVRDVVDQEPQPCGCPAPTLPARSVAEAGAAGTHLRSGDEASPPSTVKKEETVVASPSNGGPSSTPADTAFPLAESEGLSSPPAMTAMPKAVPGTTESQVTSTLSYIAPKRAVPVGTPDGMATPESAATVATEPAPGFGPTVNTGPAGGMEPAPRPPHKRGFFGKVGHFFARIFG